MAVTESMSHAERVALELHAAPLSHHLPGGDEPRLPPWVRVSVALLP